MRWERFRRGRLVGLCDGLSADVSSYVCTRVCVIHHWAQSQSVLSDPDDMGLGSSTVVIMSVDCHLCVFTHALAKADKLTPK